MKPDDNEPRLAEAAPFVCLVLAAMLLCGLCVWKGCHTVLPHLARVEARP